MTTLSGPLREITLEEFADHSPATPARRVFGVLRLACGALVLVALASQISDQVDNDVFEPAFYFSFFTVQTSILNAMVLLTAGVLALRWRDDTAFFTAFRMTTVVYATVTGVVHAVLLRGVPDEGFEPERWPIETMHVVIPALIALDWVFGPGRARLRWGSIWIALVYPLLWLGFTLVRGPIDRWYPYAFLDPDAPAGPASVVGHVGAIFVFVIAVACLAVAITRIGRRRADK